MNLFWNEEGENSPTSLEKEARKLNPWFRRYLLWRYPLGWGSTYEPKVDAHPDWTTPRRWRARALLAWLVSLVVAAAWLAVLVFLATRSEQRYDLYEWSALAWAGTSLAVYSLGWMRDRRKRLKPSPFFFWFRGW